jgi:hypothetical protein
MPKPVPFQPWIDLEQQPGPDTIGTLRVGMKNVTNETWVLYGSSPNPYAGSHSTPGIRVADNPAAIEDGCPRGAAIAENSIRYEPVNPRQSTSLSNSIYVIHDRDVCFPSGEHRFSGKRDVYTSRDADNPALAFRWWFKLIAQ